MKKLLLVELIAWSGCVMFLAIVATIRVQAHASSRIAEGIGVNMASTSETGIGASKNSTSGESGLVGRLEIQSIHLSVPIFSGVESSTLRHGVGHIDGTAMPGGLGNMALAGHRDTFFRALKDIQPGIPMAVVTEEGRYVYIVDSTAIVLPEDVQVVSIHDVPELTLITCYPFEFIGSAPKRFIVTAHLQSLTPIRE